MLAERLRYVARMASKNSQRVAILDSDIFAFHRQHAAFLESTQQTTDGFYREAEIVTNISASHGQAEFARRESTLGKTTGQVVDEGR
ncbi:hypothetical protein D3C81_2162360 [compost metagenome]